ncbi:MAG TPA: sulfite exporter TauE/SafE family protein [Acidobacteriota bacterium]|nr:sulfite exporter TauE/SafE family protein [Acidobacteriota bacterium]
MLSGVDFVVVGCAAVVAGAINALAGGGTLITFPTLLALGVPPITANVTNTIALCPGFLGGIVAQLKDLTGQKRRFWTFLGASAAGGVVGSTLLLCTGERAFMALVPFLILTASCLLAMQGLIGAWLARRSSGPGSGQKSETWAVIVIGIVAIYGGYFGVAMSVVVLSLLGLLINDNLTRLNAIKQTVAFGANGAAAVLFVFSGKVVWAIALVMAAGALIGGTLGGRLAGRIKPDTLRWTVVSIGIVLAVIYFFRH